MISVCVIMCAWLHVISVCNVFSDVLVRVRQGDKRALPDERGLRPRRPGGDVPPEGEQA